MKIAIDLDEVIYPFTDVWLKTYAEISGQKIHLPLSPVDYNLLTWPGVDPKIGIKAFKAMETNGGYVNSAPITDALQLLEYFDMYGHEVIILTARATSIPGLAIATEGWLDSNFIHYSDLVVVPRNFEKHHFCTAWDIEILIDDKFETIAEAYTAGIPTPILLDKPWNRRTSNFEHLKAFNFVKGYKSIAGILNEKYGSETFPKI